MKNEVFYSNDLKSSVRRIDKREARRLYNNNVEVFFQSSNLRFDNVWQRPMPARKDGYSFSGHTFDRVCDDYASYNCDAERGRQIHFYTRA